MTFHKVGLQYTRDLMTGSKIDPIAYMAFGAGSNAFNWTDVQLGSELFPSGAGSQRNAIYSSIEQPVTMIYTGRIEADQLSGGSITELALSDAVSGNKSSPAMLTPCA